MDSKPWNIHAMEYYSVLKRNELSVHENTWIQLKCILLNERSQSKKADFRVIPTVWYSGKGKTAESVYRSGVAKG